MIVALILSVLLLSTTLVGVCVLYEQARRELRRPRSIQILLPRADDGVIGVTVDGKPMPAGWNLDVSYEFGEPEQPSVATELERSRIDAVREVHGSHSGEVVGFYTEGWVDRKTFRESVQTYMRENGWAGPYSHRVESLYEQLVRMLFSDAPANPLSQPTTRWTARVRIPGINAAVHQTHAESVDALSSAIRKYAADYPMQTIEVLRT